MLATRDDPAKILVAAIVGFAAGLLFAPKSGQETREQIRHKADEARDRVRHSADEVKNYAREGKEQLKQAAANVRRHGQELKEDFEEQAENIDMNNTAAKSKDKSDNSGKPKKSM